MYSFSKGIGLPSLAEVLPRAYIQYAVTYKALVSSESLLSRSELLEPSESLVSRSELLEPSKSLVSRLELLESSISIVSSPSLDIVLNSANEERSLLKAVVVVNLSFELLALLVVYSSVFISLSILKLSSLLRST